MSLWFCRECRRAFHQESMLSGWNGLWCPNCVWDEVVPTSAGGIGQGDPGARDPEGEAPDADPGGSSSTSFLPAA